MDFLDLAKLMYRWWFVTLPLVLLTLVSALIVSSRVQAEYTARGSINLVAPTVTFDEEASTVNPLLSVNGALPTTAYVTALSATSPDVANLLASEGLSTSYDVAAQDRLPIILLETRAESREIATDTAERLVEIIDQDLQFKQDAAVVPAEDRVTAEVISVSIVGGADYGGRLRLRIAIIGFGLVATVGVAFLLESLSSRGKATTVSTDEIVGDPDPVAGMSAGSVAADDGPTESAHSSARRPGVSPSRSRNGAPRAGARSDDVGAPSTGRRRQRTEHSD